MINTYRCKIKKELGKYFIGQDYSGNKYKIEKNKYINCKVGDDLYFYAKKEKRFLSTILVPVSDEEAGVIDTRGINVTVKEFRA